MPGTISSNTDPAITTSSNSKAFISSSASQTSLISDSSPPSHPSSGVASKGISSLMAKNHSNAALASTNKAAQSTNSISKNTSNTLAKKEKDQVTEDQKKEHELRKFVETEGHFSLVRNFHLADAFTLMNGFCGAQSLFSSGKYLLTSDPKHAWMALWFPLFGAIFDLLDGKVARWRKSSSMLGQELDSLADSLSFGAAPAFAAFALGLRLPLDTLFLTIFVCSGIARLARFNVTTASIPHDASGKARYFEGLPIPSSLILVGGMALCLLAGRVEPGSLPLITKDLTFTGSLKETIPGALSGKGVPLGKFSLDLTEYLIFGVKKLDGTLGLGLKRETINWLKEYGLIEMHKLSLIWGVWATLLLSKTIHFPKF